MLHERIVNMSDSLQLPVRGSHQHLSVPRYGREQYARIQGHLYEHAAAADAVRRWVLAQPIHTLLFKVKAIEDEIRQAIAPPTEDKAAA
jgi:hypothetical protein